MRSPSLSPDGHSLFALATKSPDDRKARPLAFLDLTFARARRCSGQEQFGANGKMSHELYRLIRLLERERVHFRLDRHRDDTIMITATLVGERIEIDVFEDGSVNYSRFRGDESAEVNVSELEALLSDFNRQ